MKIWLDDFREPPDTSWRWTKSAEETIALFCCYSIAEISLDHDLGEGQKTGYDVIKWIEKEVIKNGNTHFFPYKITVHSANPVGGVGIKKAVKRIKEFINENQKT